jgi:hypothetical protein
MGEEDTKPSVHVRSGSSASGPADMLVHPHLANVGSRRFWLASALVALVAFCVLAIQYTRLTEPDALVPVVTLTGPDAAAAGENVRFGVLVRDRFGAPIPSAPVRIGFARNGFNEIARGTTGPSGDASIEVAFPKDFMEERTLVALAEVGVARGEDATSVFPRVAGKGTLFVSTDKPLYQPGQTIHIRAVAMAEPKPVAERPAVIEVRTEDGIKVFRAEKQTSAFGVVSADFVLADQVKLGTYRILVTTSVAPLASEKPDAGAATDDRTNRVAGERRVDVKRYELPKLTASFEDLSPLLPDEPLVGKVRARWMFGSPVTHARVGVTLGDRSANGVLDKDGVFAFELRPNPARKPSEQPRGSFPLEARVFVEGGLKVETKTTLTTREKNTIQIEAFPESGPLVAGIVQSVHVVVTRDPMPGISVRALPDGPIAKTSERGIATITVRPPLPEPGKSPAPVKISAFAGDGSESTIEVPVTNDALVVRPDRDSYESGASVRVTILGANPGDHVALRMTKGAEPITLGTCVVTPAAKCESTLSIPPSTSGLVWIHALSMPVGKREVETGKRLVIVAGGSRVLTLKATPDRASYAPRDVGAIDVAVTSAGGSPVKAQLGVAVADEAVFALADVRPDLEKIFFTIDQDLASTRGMQASTYSSKTPSSGGRLGPNERRPPEAFPPSMAYPSSTPDDVRGTILAALTTMPAAGNVDAATSNEIADRAERAVRNQKSRLGGRFTLLVSLLALAAFAGFAVYGVTRVVRPLPESVRPSTLGHTNAFRIETRALYVDWLIAALGPPSLAATSALLGETIGTRGASAELVVATWAVLGIFFAAVMLVRAVLRVRRAVELQMDPLRRAVVFLPVAAFFAHVSSVLVAGDRSGKLQELFDYPRDALFFPLAVLIAAQLTTGLISVIGQTGLRWVSLKGRMWLLWSRASFVGLPATLALAVFLVVDHVKTSRISWADYVMETREAEHATESASDNKEGGTGTRAKGEEGSMGNPSASGTHRYAVAGPSDNPTRAPILRDYFPETLLWAPEIITDDSGHAKVTVPFADSITTWRFGLKAVGRGGQLGSATIPLVVKQDFFVDASLPPTLTQGDEIVMPVSLFSYVTGAQDVALEIEGASIVGPASMTVRLQPHDSKGLSFRLRFAEAGERVVRIKATGPTRGDAIERKVLVVPNGQAVTRAVNARLIGSATTETEFPPQAIDGGNDLYVKVYGGPLSQISEGLDGVFLMPHGCFEQTSSTTYPSILALDFLTRTKSVSSDVEKKARDYIGQGFQRLVSFEVNGRGFSLFGNAPAQTSLTAYGLMEFADLARVSDIVDESLLKRTRSWLYDKRNAAGGWAKLSYDTKVDPTKEPTDALTTAYVAWAIASVAMPNEQDAALPGVLDVVERAGGPEAIEPYALVLRANALLAGGRAAQARPLLDRLATLAIHDDEGVHWTSKSVGVMYSYGGSMDVEVTGLASHALARAELAPELRNGALSWLVRRRGAHGTWSTTQATIAAMRALLDEAKPSTNEAQDITVLVDGAPAESFRLEPAARDVHRLISLRKAATSGKHVVEVRATGKADVSYQLVATHYLRWQKQAGSSPLTLDVAYSPTSVPTGGVTTARVRLAWKGNEPARMPLVEVAIPPAFEAETYDLDKLVADATSHVRRYTVERGKVTLYLVELAQDQPLTLDLPLRALRPARVVAPSSVAYLYYEPEVRSETAPVVMEAQ